MEEVIRTLFSALRDVRYVAIYRDGTITSRERSDLANASSSESDKYEELFVNPTLLKLLEQRGNVDCGGLRYVIIRYGNFFQYVKSWKGGHISISIEPEADLPASIGVIERTLSEQS